MLFFLLFLLLFSAEANNAASVSVRFLEVPKVFSSSSSAAFRFEVLTGNSEKNLCRNCNVSCKLDGYDFVNCVARKVSYTGLPDGEHTFDVCAYESQETNCTSYKWKVDTVSPTAYVSLPTNFTNSMNVSANISFSEPCPGGGGFRCTMNECNLLVYGAGRVLPSTLKVLQPDQQFSLIVSLSADVLYGRLELVLERHFCTDASGNWFTRSSNSSALLHFDRRSVVLDIETRIPQRLLQLDDEIRTVQATNRHKNLRIYLHFSEPVLNTSTEILSVLRTSTGDFLPTNRKTLGSRRFGYVVNNVSSMAIVTINCETSSIIGRQGTAVSPVAPITFLYDVQRPSVMLSTTSNTRTRERRVPVWIKFTKPVFNFSFSVVSISGGHMLSFYEVSKSIYRMDLHADGKVIAVEVPENAAVDIAGNKNLGSNRLQVWHYSVPSTSLVISTITITAYAATSVASALLTICTASLLSAGAFPKSSIYLVTEPSRNLMRITSHLQIFALSRWLAPNLPIEYYEFTKAIQWSIPYLNLPWESGNPNFFREGSRFQQGTYPDILQKSKLELLEPSTTGKGSLNSTLAKPFTQMEYMSFLESRNMKPQAEYLEASQNSNGWKDFGNNMFWLAVICGVLVLIHAAVLFVLKIKRKKADKQKEFGALVFPRFEMFLILLGLPCLCQAAASIIRGRSTLGVIVGTIILGFVALLLLSLLVFLTLGITFGKLLQYKEVHREGQVFHWYQELIRVCLGPGKRGQWTWKDKANSIQLIKLGPVFEDLRGPPKYMLSQISGGGQVGKSGDRIIASDDETEDAEAPFIQKLFGILRIYYTFLETVKRVALGIVVGSYNSSVSHSKIPVIIVLSITSFQLFFMVLKKPFIKKKVQLVEIISVASELAIFAACLLLLEKDFSEDGQKLVGYLMLGVFVVAFMAQMSNEWYALYRQLLRLSPAGGNNSISWGLKAALTGLLLLILPGRLLSKTSFHKQMIAASSQRGEDAAGPSYGGAPVTRGSGTSEKPWLRQLRELAKASFSRDEGGGGGGDPSGSRAKWSGLWSGKRSGSSSITSSADFKNKGDTSSSSRAKSSKGLYKDLEAIFSSK